MTEATLSTGRPLEKLRLTASSTNTESRSRSESSISSQQLLWRAQLPRSSRRTLDFDVECVAAGFADPAWVPVRITAWAYSWVGDGTVHVEALPVADFYNHDARRRFMLPLLAVIEAADVVTGHNIIRADLRWLNAECMNLGLPLLPSLMVQDTIRLPRSGGFKKGQDNMSYTLGVREEKLPLMWAEWEAAYSEPGLETVKDRVAGDVRQHMELRERMRDAGWLRAPKRWNP